MATSLPISQQYVFSLAAILLPPSKPSFPRACLGTPLADPDVSVSQWNFDGSSTGQAPGDNSDVYLKPVAVYPDPFRTLGGDNILVLSECWMSDGTPNKFNHRHECAKLMEKHAAQKPWFGLEQEYTLLDINDRPFGWVSTPSPKPLRSPRRGALGSKVTKLTVLPALARLPCPSGPILLRCRRRQGRPA